MFYSLSLHVVTVPVAVHCLPLIACLCPLLHNTKLCGDPLPPHCCCHFSTWSHTHILYMYTDQEQQLCICPHWFRYRTFQTGFTWFKYISTSKLWLQHSAVCHPEPGLAYKMFLMGLWLLNLFFLIAGHWCHTSKPYSVGAIGCSNVGCHSHSQLVCTSTHLVWCIHEPCTVMMATRSH